MVLCDQDFVIGAIPLARPAFVGPAHAEWEIELRPGQQLIKRLVQQLLALKPIVVIAEAVDAMKPRQLYLPRLNLRQAQVVKSQLTRQTWLMVSLELRLASRDRRPLREALPPPLVVFGN